MDTLEVRGLTKRFGQNEVLKGVELLVPRHCVYGLIGQNGAGKTTTMRIILGLLAQDAGEVYVCGEKVKYGETKTNRFVGYLPDVPEFYGFMPPEEYLRLCGRICGMEHAQIREKSGELLELSGLKESRKKRIGGFSRGMKQRLGIAQALLNGPKLLICDEPTSALDPVGRKEILDILEQVKEKTTVIFSTHILSDVERICDSVAFLNDGIIIQDGTLEELKMRHIVDTMIVELCRQEDMQWLLKKLEGLQVSRQNKTTLVIHAKDIYTVQHRLMNMLADGQIAVEKLEIQEPSLENLFMEAVK